MRNPKSQSSCYKQFFSIFEFLIFLLHFEENFVLNYRFPPHLRHKDCSLSVSLFEAYQVIRIKLSFSLPKKKYVAKPKHSLNSEGVFFKF